MDIHMVFSYGHINLYSNNHAMTKKIFAAIFVSIFLVGTIGTSFVQAVQTESIPVAQSWQQDGFTVDKLDFYHENRGPSVIGDQVIVSEGCSVSETCNFSGSWSVLKDGVRRRITNLDYRAIHAPRLQSQDSNLHAYWYWDETQGRAYVVTVNLASGDVHRRGFEGIDERDIQQLVVDGSYIYFVTRFYEDGRAKESLWIAKDDLNNDTLEAKHISYLDSDRTYKILDVRDGIALLHMTFPDGATQLFTFDYHSGSPFYEQLQEVKDSWTDSDKEIIGAHFKSAGVIEYFQYSHRMIFDIGAENSVQHSQQLNWDLASEVTSSVVEGHIAWIDPEGFLYISDETGTRLVAHVPEARFWLTGDRIFFANDDGAYVYQLADRETRSLPFYPSHVYGGAIVGCDGDGNILFGRISGQITTVLGYGSSPVLSDESHVYWRGVDDSIFGAIIGNDSSSSLRVWAFRTAADPTVYMIKDGVRRIFTNEQTYFTYFSSWDSVGIISKADLSNYSDAGTMRYARGTRVKLETDPKVYIVGDNGYLHWIKDEQVAYEVFGATWNQNILDISFSEFISYELGSSIRDTEDALVI